MINEIIRKYSRGEDNIHYEKEFEIIFASKQSCIRRLINIELIINQAICDIYLGPMNLITSTSYDGYKWRSKEQS